MKNKALAVCGIWIGYGIAVVGVSFGSATGISVASIGTAGAVCALLATAVVVVEGR